MSPPGYSGGSVTLYVLLAIEVFAVGVDKSPIGIVIRLPSSA